MYINIGPGVLRSRSRGVLLGNFSRIHSIDESDSANQPLGINSFFHGLDFNQNSSIQETSRSAVLACAMASFAAVIWATLLSEPLAASSAWK